MSELSNEERKYLASIQDYQIAFSTDEGRRVLHDLMQMGNMLKPSFIKDKQTGKVDSHEMAFNEGMRNLVLFIFHRLNVDVKQLEHEIRERAKNERNYRSGRSTTARQ